MYNILQNPQYRASRGKAKFILFSPERHGIGLFYMTRYWGGGAQYSGAGIREFYKKRGKEWWHGNRGYTVIGGTRYSGGPVLCYDIDQI